MIALRSKCEGTGASCSSPSRSYRAAVADFAGRGDRALEFAAEEAGRDPGCLNQGLKLAAALYGLWVRRGPVAEGALHLGRLLDLDDALQAGHRFIHLSGFYIFDQNRNIKKTPLNKGVFSFA